MSLYWTSYWALQETRVDPEVFFRELVCLLPEATTLYVEGTSINEEVKAALLAHAQVGTYLPSPEADSVQILGSLRTVFFRCEFTPSLLRELERFAGTYAEPEICGHLLVYAGSEPILEFYDFPHNEIWLPITVSEERVRALASVLSTTYRREIADVSPRSLAMKGLMKSFAAANQLTATAAAEFLDGLPASTSYTVALSGGRIAKDFFNRVARLTQERGQSLANVHFFWADERCVPPTDAESNYRIATELLFEPFGLSVANIHRIRGEDEPEAAARAVEAELRRIAPANAAGQPVLDLVLLGMGEDGHIASLFPGESEEVMQTPAVYRAVTASKPPPRRITLGYAAIAAAREVWVLASGAGKEAALRESLSPDGTTPLARVLRGRERTCIFTDLSGYGSSTMR